MGTKSSVVTILVALALAFCALLPAQTTTTGNLAGMVNDSSGAVVPGATVTIKDLNTGESRTVQSNSTGAYRFTFLRPGVYQISGSVSGLKSDIGRVTIGVADGCVPPRSYSRISGSDQLYLEPRVGSNLQRRLPAIQWRLTGQPAIHQ